MRKVKLEILLKELPWLEALDDLIPRITHIKVTRMDIDFLRYRGVGEGLGLRDSNIHGYFISKEGALIKKLHVMVAPDTSFIGWVRTLLGLDATVVTKLKQTILTAAKSVSDPDAIRFVVLIEYVNDFHFELSIAKLPRDKTMSDLMNESRLADEAKRSLEVEEAKTEVLSVLSD